MSAVPENSLLRKAARFFMRSKDPHRQRRHGPSQGASTTEHFGQGEVHPYVGLVEHMDILRVRPLWVSYMSALLITAAAIGMRRWLDVFGDGLVPFAIFYPTVLACTLVGGRGGGLLSLAGCSIAATIFWLEPKGFFEASAIGLVNLAFFVTTSGSIILVAHFLRSGFHRLRQSEQRLSLALGVGRIGLWDLDLKSGALWWSPSFYEVSGINPAQAPSIEAVIQRIDAADRDRAYEAFETARRGHDRLDIEFRFHKDDGTIIWLASRAELFRNEDGRPSRLIGINFDATPFRTMASERDRANTLLHTFFDSLPGAAYAKDAEGRILMGNPGFAEALGVDADKFLGRTDLENIRDEAQARAIMAHDQAVMHAGVSKQFEEDLASPDGQMVHWLSIKTPFKNAEGEVQGIIGLSLDVTERRKAQHRLRFLVDEVDHRAKNLLGVVQSIVRLTRADDIATFKTALEGRIQALARTHTLLAASRWEGADLTTLVNEELAPFHRTGFPQIILKGPPVNLKPNASQALAMVLHELAINAARHGALSVPKGKLLVAWQISENENQSNLELNWTETHGPPVAVQMAPGFGSTAIRGAIVHQLGGKVTLDWEPSGLRCHIVFPVEGGLEVKPLIDEEPSSRTDPATAEGQDNDLSGKLVLILDDEPLIAITLTEIVEELGCKVTSPAPSSEAALNLIKRRAPDVAVLDVNLAGASSAPVAHALLALRIPFVYCTGYAETANQIEAALQAPMITKPIDPTELKIALQHAIAG